MSVQHVTDLEVIEHLDFAAELPCEHSEHSTRPEHGGPAKYLIRRFSHCPGRPRLLLICEGVWNAAGVRGLFCAQCGTCWTRDEGWQIVEVLR